MAEEEKKGGGSILSIPTLLLLSALAGGLFWIPSALVPARPEGDRRNMIGSLGSQDVEARLWQDPFEALEMAGVPPVEKAEVEGKFDVHDIGNLGRQIDAAFLGWNPGGSQNGSTQLPFDAQIEVVLAMVAGGPYPEDVESRIRSRVAYMAALGTAGYRNDDENQIGYATARWPQSLERDPAGTLAGENWAKLVLPYEWFTRRIHHPDSIGSRASRSNHVLLVWLRDSMFADEPLHRLNDLIGYLHQQRPSDRFKVSIIGPRTSSTLRQFFSLSDWDLPQIPNDESLRKATSQRAGLSGGDWLKGTALFSPAATTMDGLLVPGGEQGSSREEIKRRLGLSGITFTNVTCTDDALAGALLGELARRNIDVSQAANHIALISEWDSFYGRTMPMTFAYRLEQMLGDTAPDLLHSLRFAAAKHGNRIHKFSYLQGIDGKIPGRKETNASEGKPAAESALGEKKKQPESNRAEGPSQLDYIPRLADRIEQENRQLLNQSGGADSAAIKAIGVVGSDLYDKLLVLQALRPRFPNATFFTTDLDARLWQPTQLKWTRNLVVASSFGLELRRGLQQDIPPFRDSYQTAQYLSCLAALGAVPADALHAISPRLFEIGRRGAIDLSGPAVTQGGTNKRLGFFASLAAQYHAAFHESKPNPLYPPPRTDFSWDRSKSVAMWLTLSVALALALLGRVSPLVRRYVTQRRQTLIDEISIKAEDIRDEARLVAALRDKLPQLCKTVFVPESFKKALTTLGAVPEAGASSRSPETIACDAKVSVIDGLNRMIRDQNLGSLDVNAVLPVRFRSGRLQRMLRNRLALEHHAPGALFPVSHLLTVTHRSLSNFARYGWIAPAAALALLFVAVVDNQGAAEGEPFTWTDGVSAWPSQFIRLLVVILSLVFILRGEEDLRRNFVDISRRFHLRFGKHDRPPSGGSRIATWRNISVGIRARSLWLEYRWLGRQKRRAKRIAAMAAVYLVSLFSLAAALGTMNTMPTRGVLSSSINSWLLGLTVVTTITLNFFVVDATRLCQRFIQNLSSMPTLYPSDTLQQFRCGATPAADDDLDEWIDMQIIASRSAQVSRLIYYPFITLFLMIVARAHYWDDWAWQPLLVLIFVLNGAWAISSALVLQRSARQAKARALEAVREKICRLPASAAEPRLKRLKKIAEDIEAMNSGAFAGYTNNPILGALSLPFTGTAVAFLLEFVTSG